MLLKQNIKLLILVFISSSIFYISCTTDKNIQSDINQIKLKNSFDILADTAFLCNLSVIKLETNTDFLIRNINRIIQHDNKFVVLDKALNQVLIFDHNGKALNKIKNIGSGPGEYIHLRDITFNNVNNNITLLTDPAKIINYSLDGKFINELSLSHPFNSILFSRENYYFLRSTYTNNNLSDYSIMTMNFHTGKQTTLLEPLPEIAPYCSNGKNVLNGISKPIYTRKFDNNIYQLQNDSLFSIYELDFDINNFPSRYKKEKFNCEELNKLCFDNNYIYMMSNVKETDDFILFDTNLFGIYLIHKSKKELSYYKMIKNIKYNFPLPNYLPVEGQNNLVAFVYPAQYFLLLPDSKNICEDFDSLKGLEEDSNPLLFLYTIKSN